MTAKFWIRDLGVFFGDFQSTATYTATGGSACEVDVIFDNEYLAADFLEASAATKEPQVWIRTSDAENADAGDTLKLDGTTYYVTSVEPDGTGLTRLILSKDQT